jgi:hypothetical protein
MRSTTSFGVLAFACAVAQVRAQTLIGSQSGVASQNFGAAVISAGFQDSDTYADLLVGSPGLGRVDCISGRFLATGAGANVLWTITSPGSSAGFGSSIAAVGDLTGDGVTDFVVGEPLYKFNPFGSVTNGAVHLVNGASHTLVATIYGSSNTRLGGVVVSVNDQNGDGKHEVAVTALPTNTVDPSQIHIISGAAFSGTKSLANASHSSLNSSGANEFGETLASGFDLNGDGKRDLAIGSPRMFGESGMLSVVSADGLYTTLAAYTGASQTKTAASISATHDYNGDGVVDFVVGAPGWSTNHAVEDGRALVLSGANLRTFSLPYELATFSIGTGGTHNRFGAAVRASADLNRDGVGDFLIGAPEYSTFTSAKRGQVAIYSGATLTKLATLVGASNERLGAVLLGALQDVNGDLAPEFVVAGPAACSGGVSCGVVKLYSLAPFPPSTYCVGKVNSQGCTPAMGSSGFASASSAAPFDVRCSNALNLVNGLFFYSHAPQATQFQGGTKCVASPFRRTPLLASGGIPGGVNCSGVLSYDFNARIQSGVDTSLVVSAEIFVQCWSRDSASPSGTSLSNGLRFFINP